MKITINEEQKKVLLLVIEDAIDNLDMDNLDEVHALNQITEQLTALQHLKDIQYKGHEIVIMQQGNKYAVDVRADDFDGEMIAGVVDLDTEAEAETKAKAYIDKITMVLSNNTDEEIAF